MKTTYYQNSLNNSESSMSKTLRALIFIVLGLVLFAVELTAQTTRNVVNHTELVNAITASVSGDIIHISNSIVVSSEVTVNKNITINGNGYEISVPRPGLDEMGRYNASPSNFRVFNIPTSGTAEMRVVTINRLAIKGGSVAGHAGAINVAVSASLTLNECIVSNSRASSGGGGIGTAGTLYLNNSYLRRNAANYGGGLIILSNGRAYVEQSSLIENRSTSIAGGGGGVECQSGGIVYFNNSTLANNQSTEIGGAINNYMGTVYFINSSATGNVAFGSFNGGAIGNNNGNLYIVNSLFAHNYRRTSGTTANPTGYVLDDIQPHNSAGNIRMYYSAYHASLPIGIGVSVGNVQYTGAQNGNDNSIFSGGILARITDNDGNEIGDQIFRPFLYENAGGVAPTLQPGSFVTEVENRGTPTRFSNNNNVNPALAYYHDGSFVTLLGTPVAGQEVTVDQVNATRSATTPARGAIETETNTQLYIVKVNGASGGTVSGGTIYGDVYASGTSVTLTAIPNAGQTFVRWDYVAGGSGTASTANPYTFTVSGNVTLVPVFAASAGGDYSVTYIGNGSTGGTAPAVQTQSGSVVIENQSTLVRAGYSFVNWNTNSNGSGISYAVGATYSAGVNVTLYAQWEKNPPFIWNGTENTVETLPNNWNVNAVPGENDDVIISALADHPIVISGPLRFNSLTIENAGSNDNMVIAPTGNITVNRLINEGSIVIESNNIATGQLQVEGVDLNTGTIVLRKTFVAGPWVFVGFPFEVTANRIFIAGTDTQATWGDIYDAGDVKTFYARKYDAAGRDVAGTAQAQNGLHWINVTPHVFSQRDGYIIAVPNNITLDFVSAPGDNGGLGTSASKVVNKYTQNVLQTHNSWNLLGQPFLSGFDLLNASQAHAPYYNFNGFTYVAIMAGDSYVVYPFTAFFVQAYGAGATVEYASLGRTLRSVSAPSFEQITLVVQDNVEATYTDNTRIRIEEGRTVNYELGHDAVKMLSMNALVPQIYTRTKAMDNVTYSYAVNALPTNTAVVDLVVTTGKAGSYTISLENIDDAPSYSSIILVVGTKEYNLLEGSYTFSTSKAQTMNWKVKLVQGVVTQVAQNDENSIDVSTIENKVYISGLESEAKVAVYTLNGKFVQVIESVQNNQALTINNTGVSVLMITTATQQAQAKVLVE
jgi:uncharacterized repeat protein (TIGR02543 family)